MGGIFIYFLELIDNQQHTQHELEADTQNGFQFKSMRTKLSTATHYTLSRSTNVFGGLQGRAMASYFKVVWPKCTSACSI